ncbi:MAG: 30S ribosomal protein S9 [Spirochaetaceae bacterium]|nr:30S ribosomal protein S9 [Spirochaetaceae bacterium]
MAETDSINLALGTGRRKTAVARIFLRRTVAGAGAGETDLQRVAAGQITVNGKSLDDYFNSEELVQRVTSPLDVTDNLGKLSVIINVSGGGPAGPAGRTAPRPARGPHAPAHNQHQTPSRHGLARALDAYDDSNHESLRANGFLTRDRRMVERKKYGRPKARKRFQFSKR